ncbi:MAG: hypothetical protein AAFN77_23825 [Planctomycetota bacterium]
MKYSILSILTLTTIFGLGIALYVQHSENKRRESSAKSKHREELQQQKEGLSALYTVENLLENYRYRNQRSVRPDYDASALSLIVSTFQNSEFLNRDHELRAKYGDTPATAIAAKLLMQLDCGSVEKYFELYRKKIEMFGMTGEEEYFGLGADDSDRRKQLTEFIQHAIDRREADVP